MLGTLVEVAVSASGPTQAIDAAFAVMQAVERSLSRFDPESELSRWHAAPPGQAMAVSLLSQRVLRVAHGLWRASAGIFDVSLGTGPQDWSLAGGQLLRRHAQVRLDLGGVAKGWAVDLGVRALQASGASAGWVNAGGDLRCFGALSLPLSLRDERLGGARPWAVLQQGAVATSVYQPGSRSRLHGAEPVLTHLSVIAPRCVWADALTKVVAATGDLDHPLLHRLGASAVAHDTLEMHR